MSEPTNEAVEAVAERLRARAAEIRNQPKETP